MVENSQKTFKNDPRISGKTYSVSVSCHNCGHRWEKEIEKGTPVKTGTGNPLFDCPNCEVEAGHVDPVDVRSGPVKGVWNK